eukprot:GHVR01054820.1.p1 GENE.GHVR01054820.1~~GHVR01054820.1.p1  ORF type:complete len:277 (-),score=51.81 GHVR01054820.1:3-833(-)
MRLSMKNFIRTPYDYLLFIVIIIVCSLKNYSFIVKLVNVKYDKEYELMGPKGKTSDYIVKRVTKQPCDDIIFQDSENYYYHDKLHNNLCMVFEKYEGDVFEMIVEEKKVITPQMKYMWVKELLTVLQFLHKNDVIHNDVSLENMFLTDDDHIRLGYFEFAKDVTKEEDKTVDGTPQYFSAERAQAFFDKKNGMEIKSHTSKADVFAAGVVTFAICFNKFIHSDPSEDDPSYTFNGKLDLIASEAAEFDWDKYSEDNNDTINQCYMTNEDTNNIINT